MDCKSFATRFFRYWQVQLPLSCGLRCFAIRVQVSCRFSRENEENTSVHTRDSPSPSLVSSLLSISPLSLSCRHSIPPPSPSLLHDRPPQPPPAPAAAPSGHPLGRGHPAEAKAAALRPSPPSPSARPISSITGRRGHLRRIPSPPSPAAAAISSIAGQPPRKWPGHGHLHHPPSPRGEKRR
jgi:hypothetical protein